MFNLICGIIVYIMLRFDENSYLGLRSQIAAFGAAGILIGSGIAQIMLG